MLRAYKLFGYDAVGFVGHDKMANVQDDELTILNGIEHTENISPEVHIVSYPDQGLRFFAHPRRRSKVNIRKTAQWEMNKRGININEKYNGGKLQYEGSMNTIELGNSDAHNVFQVDSSYNLIDADNNPQAIANAVKAGNVDAKRGLRRPFGWVVKRVHASINTREGLQYVDDFLEKEQRLSR